MKFDCKIWHCTKCGKQQTTTAIESLSGACGDCKELEQKESEAINGD